MAKDSTNTDSSKENDVTIVEQVIDEEVLYQKISALEKNADEILAVCNSIKTKIQELIKPYYKEIKLIAISHERRLFINKALHIYNSLYFENVANAYLRREIPNTLSRINSLAIELRKFNGYEQLTTDILEKVLYLQKINSENSDMLQRFLSSCNRIRTFISRDDIVAIVNTDPLLSKYILSPSEQAKASVSIIKRGGSAAPIVGAGAPAGGGASAAPIVSTGAPAGGAASAAAIVSAGAPAGGAASAAAIVSAGAPAGGVINASDSERSLTKKEFNNPTKDELRDYLRKRYKFSQELIELATSVKEIEEIGQKIQVKFDELVNNNIANALKFIYINKRISNVNAKKLLEKFPKATKLYNLINEVQYLTDLKQIIDLLNINFADIAEEKRYEEIFNFCTYLHILIGDQWPGQAALQILAALQNALGEEAYEKINKKFQDDVITQYKKDTIIDDINIKIAHLINEVKEYLTNSTELDSFMNTIKNNVVRNFIELVQNHEKGNFYNKTNNIYNICTLQYRDSKRATTQRNKNFELEKIIIRKKQAIAELIANRTKEFDLQPKQFEDKLRSLTSLIKQAELKNVNYTTNLKLIHTVFSLFIQPKIDGISQMEPNLKSLLAAAGHEFKNPLKNIFNNLGFRDYCLYILGKSTEGRWKVDILNQAIQTLTNDHYVYIKNSVNKLYNLLFDLSDHENALPLRINNTKKEINFIELESTLRDIKIKLKGIHNFWDLHSINLLKSALFYYNVYSENNCKVAELMYKYGMKIDLEFAIKYDIKDFVTNTPDSEFATYFHHSQDLIIYIFQKLKSIELLEAIFYKKKDFFENEANKNFIIYNMKYYIYENFNITLWFLNLKNDLGKSFLDLDSNPQEANKILLHILENIRVHNNNDAKIIISCINSLLGYGANINTQCPLNSLKTGLMHFCSRPLKNIYYLKTLDHLLQLGADPSLTDINGDVALQSLIKHSCEGAVNILIKYSPLDWPSKKKPYYRTDMNALAYSQYIAAKPDLKGSTKKAAEKIITLIENELKERGGKTDVPLISLGTIQLRLRATIERTQPFKALKSPEFSLAEVASALAGGGGAGTYAGGGGAGAYAGGGGAGAYDHDGGGSGSIPIAHLRAQQRGHNGLNTREVNDLRSILVNLNRNIEFSNNMVASATNKIVTRFKENENMLEIRADGNCLYNAILILMASEHPDKLMSLFPGVDLKDINHMSLRNKIADILESPAEQDKIISRYLDSMRENILDDITYPMDDANDKIKGYGDLFETLLKIKEKYLLLNNRKEAEENIAAIPSDQITKAYIANLKTKGTFGGSIEICILANLLGVNIQIKTNNTHGEFEYNTINPEIATEAMVTIHHNLDHYNAIISEESQEKLQHCIRSISREQVSQDSGSETEEYHLSDSDESDMDDDKTLPITGAGASIDCGPNKLLGKRGAPGQNSPGKK